MENSNINKSDKTRTYLINGDFVKFHTVFKDGTEIVEEFSLYSEEIISRKVKKLKMTGKEEWINEIGEHIITKKDDDFLIQENTKNPIFIRKDTKEAFHFRIRNMNYGSENYLVELDKIKHEIVVKTLNKKYYKRFDIPDLKRLNLGLDESFLKVNFQNNTLIISYKKPLDILKQEKEISNEIKKIKKEILENPKAKYEPGCQNQ